MVAGGWWTMDDGGWTVDGGPSFMRTFIKTGFSLDAERHQVERHFLLPS